MTSDMNALNSGMVEMWSARTRRAKPHHVHEHANELGKGRKPREGHRQKVDYTRVNNVSIRNESLLLG